jgi:hypothetical protein
VTQQRARTTSLPARASLLVGLALSSALAGCRSSEVVEDQLRSRENDLREAREEVVRTHAYNDALQRELKAIRLSNAAHVPAELAALTYGVKSITLGRQTGGFNGDDQPGDEALQVVVEPLDPDGHAIKAPGTLQVEALEISPEGLKRPLSSWQVSPDELRRGWRSGLLSTGYFVILPWKVYPSVEKLRIIVHLTVEEGRVFEADRDVTVHLVPAAHRKPLPTAVPGESPTIDTPLPMPRRMDGPILEGGRGLFHRSAKAATTEPAALWSKAQAPPTGQAAVAILQPIPRTVSPDR